MVKLNLLYGLIGTAVTGGAGSAGVYFSLRQTSKEAPKKETVEPWGSSWIEPIIYSLKKLNIK